MGLYFIRKHIFQNIFHFSNSKLNFLPVYDVQTNRNHFPLTSHCCNILLNEQLCNEVISGGILINQKYIQEITPLCPRNAKYLSSRLEILLHGNNIFDRELF